MSKQVMKAANEEPDMDMTPMIDCVFLLLIFFVIVIDLSQQDMEDLILPKAEFAVPDEKPPDVRPIVNIVQDGSVVYKGTKFYDPKVHLDDFTKLMELLSFFKDNVAVDIETVNLGGRNVRIVNDPILIRADKWTEWHYVGKFMTACSQPQAAFWKLELAMSEKDKEDMLFK